MPHFRRTSGWLIILAAAMALAQTSVAPSPTEACTSDDYAIYMSALTDLYGKQKIERVILIDQFNGCCTRYGGDDAVWRQGATAAQRLLERGKGRLRRSQQDPMQRSKLINCKSSFEIVLLDAETARKSVEGKDGWKTFRDRYPNSPGITLVSRPGADGEHSHALLYVGNSCDMLCGGGTLIFLNKENGEWKVANKVTIWVS